ncbi:MAG: hypothetical protein H7228_00100 [Polaromonas sp.]|nr:hypothetical protein [Polaromonas sp.]
MLAHLAADAGAAGNDAVAGALAGVLGNSLYGTLCGAKNKGPFWPQADKLSKTSKTGMTVMIRSDENIS